MRLDLGGIVRPPAGRPDNGADLLVHAGKRIAAGIDPRSARRSAITEALTDDPEMLAAVSELSAPLL